MNRPVAARNFSFVAPFGRAGHWGAGGAIGTMEGSVGAGVICARLRIVARMSALMSALARAMGRDIREPSAPHVAISREERDLAHAGYRRRSLTPMRPAPTIDPPIDNPLTPLPGRLQLTTSNTRGSS